MLAQNFMTADELKIPEAWRAALIKTLALMDSGKLVHVSAEDFWEQDDWDAPRQFTGHFNMNDWHTNADCGTVCCIGGTAELVGGVDIAERLTYLSYPRLHDLLYPNVKEEDWGRITVANAAQALRRYLTTGHAHWDEVVIG